VSGQPPERLPAVLEPGGRDFFGDVEVGEMGVISGRRIGGVDEQSGYVGSFVVGREANATNLDLARRFYLEIAAADLGRVEGFYCDKASGRLYSRLLSDPLSEPNPAAADVAMFSVLDGVLAFLRASENPATVEELVRGAAEAEKRAADAEEQARRWRGKQKLIPLTVDDLHGPGSFPTLRAAALEIHEAGGRVRVGEHGGLVVEVPERLNQIGAGDWAAAQLEREERVRLARCAEALSLGRTVVAAALELGGAKPLHERLPDRVAVVGEA
jgi:hypothetical protein